MGYLTMCALSARARRCGSCVLPSPCPRGDLSTWCVERAIAAATLQGVPGARPGDCVVSLLCMVMQPPEPGATDQAGRRRAHAASWLPRLRHRRGQAPGPHACGASTGRLIADALCPPDPRRSGTVSHDRTALRCRAADLRWPVSQWCHQETLDPHGWLTEDEVTRDQCQLLLPVGDNYSGRSQLWPRLRLTSGRLMCQTGRCRRSYSCCLRLPRNEYRLWECGNLAVARFPSPGGNRCVVSTGTTMSTAACPARASAARSGRRPLRDRERSCG